MNYVPLYIKTNNSLLTSMIKIDELIKYAKENNLKSLTITDNNMYGVMDFYHQCLKNNIKPIVGLELKINDFKIILYCINYQGYQNLCKLSTKMSSNELTLKDLEEFNQNLICIVPYESLKLKNDLEKIYKEIYFSYNSSEQLDNLNYDNLIYMKETLYLKEEDKIYYPYLIAIRDGINVKDVTLKLNNHLDNYDEILKRFPIHLNNNYKINDMCNLVIPKLENLLPKYQCPRGLDSYSYLKEQCINGLKKIFGSTVKKAYIDRLKYELKVINKMGFNDYFLVVADYVKYAKEHDILVGPGRGSAAGSLVSYCLNITTIDPLKYNLFFERFLNEERVTMPDIDIDFAFDKRDKVINYCIDKYGEKKVVPIVTFGTLKTKQAIRDVARTLDIELRKVDTFAKILDSEKNLEDNLENSEVKKYLSFNKEFKLVYKVAMKLEGIKRHLSIHAAGIVMSHDDIDNVIPLVKYNNIYITGYDMTYLEDLGLLKMDFLGLKNLTLIDNILKDINNNLTFDNIPFDKSVFSVFKSANTIGIFQFESSGMIDFLRKFKPDNFEDLVAAIALFRPGPMDNIDLYIKRKRNIVKIDYLDPSLIDILKPTYGIIVYQEQIMQIAVQMAGYTFGQADILRRAMSKKKEDVLLKEKDRFIKNSVQNGYSFDTALNVYNLILKFASYGFNRAHSVAYSLIAYKMAYLKYYYPNIFLKNILSNVIGSSSDTKKYINDAKTYGVKILNPNINISTNDYIIMDDYIVFPLTGISYISTNIAKSILEERKNGIYLDIFDFVLRNKKVNRKCLENLIDAGAFECFNLNRKTLHENLDAILNYGEIGELLDDSLKPVLKMSEEYSDKEILSRELNVFGFYLNNHPVTKYKSLYKNVPLNKMNEYFDKDISIIVYVDKVKRIVTKKDEEMCFITGSDEVTTADIVMFPKTYSKYDDVAPGDVLLITGRIERRFDKYQMVVKYLEKLID